MIELMQTDSVTWKADGGVDEYGARQDPSSSTIDVRVEEGSHLVLNTAGEEVVSSARVFTTETGIGEKDLLTIDGRDRSIIRIEKVKLLDDDPVYLILHLA